MTKRQKLSFNSEELTQNLKTSAGQGMNAFFSPPSPNLSKTPSTQPKSKTVKKEVDSVQTPKRARTHQRIEPQRIAPAPTQTHTDADVHARTIAELKRAILNKKHLSSFTFRFKSEELETLDRITEMVNDNVDQKISKNDIVRLSLKWLLSDYEKNKHTSVLARVLASV